jgi:hypothetical protein
VLHHRHARVPGVSSQRWRITVTSFRPGAAAVRHGGSGTKASAPGARRRAGGSVVMSAPLATDPW